MEFVSRVIVPSKITEASENVVGGVVLCLWGVMYIIKKLRVQTNH